MTSVVRRTERMKLSDAFSIRQYCRHAKNLYNHANYIYRAQLGDYNHYPVKKRHCTSAYEMMDILRHHPTYRALPSHTSQQIIKVLVKAWRSFWKAMESWKKNPKAFRSRPKPPKMLPKDGFFTLYFTADQCRIRDGHLHFPRMIGLKIRTRLQNKVKQVRILPRPGYFIVEIIYERAARPPRDPRNILAIDLGLDNLIAGVSNVAPPVLIRGSAIKSYNQWYNKEKSRLQSIYALQQPNRTRPEWGEKMIRLMEQRYWRIENYLHQASSTLIQYCQKHDIDTIVIGYNEGWKQNISIGKRNNQNFVGVPFLNLVRKIEYKAEEQGISVIRHEESYTSKCSFLDNEEIRKHST
ncbi:MAG: transposase [Gammaproteobacteria bacterium]|nr:MAG: transposase [Gammaproteobacteria bacterium]